MAGILDLLAQPPIPPIDYSPPGVPPRNGAPGLWEAMIASARNRDNAVLKAYEPTKREAIGWAAADVAGALGAGRYAQQDVSRKVGELLDFIPVVSALVAGEDFGKAYNAGDYPGMAMSALGFFPGGKAVGKGVKKAAQTMGAKVTNDVISELPMD